MKYLVMECHPGYAIVLDNYGHFIKVANMNYQVGDKVDHVFETNVFNKPRFSLFGNNFLLKATSLAVSLVLVLVIGYQSIFTAYGMVRMKINPDVTMSLNRFNYVISITAMNADGEELIKDYDYKFKNIDLVTTELSKLAHDKGYLLNGGTINYAVDSTHLEWKTSLEDEILVVLSVESLKDDIIVNKVEIDEIELIEDIDDDNDDDDNDNDDIDDHDHDNDIRDQDDDNDDDDEDDEDEDSDDKDDDDDDIEAEDDDDD